MEQALLSGSASHVYSRPPTLVVPFRTPEVVQRFTLAHRQADVPAAKCRKDRRRNSQQRCRTNQQHESDQPGRSSRRFGATDAETRATLRRLGDEPREALLHRLPRGRLALGRRRQPSKILRRMHLAFGSMARMSVAAPSGQNSLPNRSRRSAPHKAGRRARFSR